MQNHQTPNDLTRTTVTLPAWLHLYYKRRALEKGVTFTQIVEETLTNHLRSTPSKQTADLSSGKGLVALSEEFYKKYPEKYKSIPKDISSKYKQYLYGGKK